jgi:hypothetical protein
LHGELQGLQAGIFGLNLISDSYAAIFITGNHNKTENEIMSFKTLLKIGRDLVVISIV